MKRRQALRTIAASTGLILAGCVSEDTGSPGEGQAQIGAIGLGNITDQIHSVTVRIERNGEQLYDKTHEVAPEPDDGMIKQTWPCEPAKFVIRAKGTADDEPQEEVFTAQKVFDPDVLLEDNGRATITHNSVGRNNCTS